MAQNRRVHRTVNMGSRDRQLSHGGGSGTGEGEAARKDKVILKNEHRGSERLEGKLHPQGLREDGGGGETRKKEVVL